MKVEYYCPVWESTFYIMDENRDLIPSDLHDWVESNFVYVYFKINYLRDFGEPFLASSHLSKLFPLVDQNKCVNSKRFDPTELWSFIPDLNLKFSLDEVYLPLDFVLCSSSEYMKNTLLVMYCEKLIRSNINRYFSCGFEEAYGILEEIAIQGGIEVDSEFMRDIYLDTGYFLVNCNLIEKKDRRITLLDEVNINNLEERLKKELERHQLRKEFLSSQYAWLLDLRQEWYGSAKFKRLYQKIFFTC